MSALTDRIAAEHDTYLTYLLMCSYRCKRLLQMIGRRT